MKGDLVVKQQIQKALRSNYLLSDADITIDVVDGSVLLGGFVDKYNKKELAKKIAKEVQGVKNCIEKIAVTLDENDKRSDIEIESDIIRQFRKNFGNSHEEIKTIVSNGNVWIEGRVKWKYQKDLAKECIVDVTGIISIENNISLPEKQEPQIDEKNIFAAIYGNPTITTDIKIEIIGNRVVLKGVVLNVEQKNLVTSLVRNVPGVREIENFLIIGKSF
ncbi:MAG TPA: BON domain-containing protein [Flavobacterium sp.]|uniref:BON domain-containing protein n=1 Tax=Flavobacterium sp. TaxID=239 RepID=UPI002BB328D4|nr:BON domain-containing protein [Flavobacterium sp.]HNP33238.1 BON domain-containing protein [Flavobacterium sp.]